MEKSPQNGKKKNNNDEIYLNDIVMEKEIMEKEFEIQSNLQIEEIYANEVEEKMKENLKEMYLQKK
jgi:hypothetical protein